VSAATTQGSILYFYILDTRRYAAPFYYLSAFAPTSIFEVSGDRAILRVTYRLDLMGCNRRSRQNGRCFAFLTPALLFAQLLKELAAGCGLLLFLLSHEQFSPLFTSIIKRSMGQGDAALAVQSKLTFVLISARNELLDVLLLQVAEVGHQVPVIERPFACILVFGVAEVLRKHAVLAGVQIQVEILGDCSDAGGGIDEIPTT